MNYFIEGRIFSIFNNVHRVSQNHLQFIITLRSTAPCKLTEMQAAKDFRIVGNRLYNFLVFISIGDIIYNIICSKIQLNLFSRFGEGRWIRKFLSLNISPDQGEDSHEISAQLVQLFRR